jgi:DNA polymerase III subunit alpha
MRAFPSLTPSALTKSRIASLPCSCTCIVTATIRFLRGVNPPEEIIAAAAAQKMPEVALPDTDGMYVAVPFYQKAKAAGVKPIVGVTLEVTVGADNPRQNGQTVPLVLLAADVEGYSNLCQLNTLRHLGQLRPNQETFAQDVGRPVTMEEVAAHSAAVIALCPASLPIRTECARLQDSFFAQRKDILTDRLYFEAQHRSPEDGRILREAERLGRELNIPLVATNNVHFLKPEEYLNHRAVNAIRTNSLLTTVASREITTGEAWFKPALAMQRLFPDPGEWQKIFARRSNAGKRIAHGNDFGCIRAIHKARFVHCRISWNAYLQDATRWRC